MLPEFFAPTAPVTVPALPTYNGYITVTQNGRYFQDELGQGFIVIGQNDAITWPGLVELLKGRSPEVCEAYIKDLREHGINVSRVMMEYAQFDFGLMENPMGVYSQSVIDFWDKFIGLAEKHNLYLLLTPYDTFWQVINWKKNPYNAGNGGPCKQMRDWLTSPEVIASHKARWEFMIKRWGGSPNIFAWDIMNEIELYWGCTPEEIDAYITEMATYIRDLEMQVWGRTHLLTTSAAAPVPCGKLGHVIYNHPLLDFANTHLYGGLGTREPVDTIECAVEMMDGVKMSIQSIYNTRPYLDTESGPIDGWIKNRKFDREYHHNMSWAHLASGGASTGMRWPYTKPHHILPEMRDNLLGVARLAATIDWTTFNSRNVSENVRASKPGILKAGCADGKTALIWLLLDKRVRRSASFNNVDLRIKHVVEDGEYVAEVWETYTGTPVASFEVTVEDNIGKFSLPALDANMRDLALVLRQVKAAPKKVKTTN
jgi:hypothetical protein